MKSSVNPPVYSQVAYDIAAKIAAGEIRLGERFTGRSLMGSQYGVSSETIRRAMRLLGDMGIISVQNNVGSVALSQKRAAEYVDQYKFANDLRALKSELRALIAQRDALNEEILEKITRITDLGERFHHSDPLRNYEFKVEPGSPVDGKSIEEMRFRQKTGATIVAIRRRDGEILLSPGPQTVFSAGDVLVVACELQHIGQVSEAIDRPAG